jgi:hypothetical protein
VTRAEVQPPRVQLGEMGDELRRRVPFVARTPRHFCDQRAIG